VLAKLTSNLGIEGTLRACEAPYGIGAAKQQQHANEEKHASPIVSAPSPNNHTPEVTYSTPLRTSGQLGRNKPYMCSYDRLDIYGLGTCLGTPTEVDTADWRRPPGLRKCFYEGN